MTEETQCRSRISLLENAMPFTAKSPSLLSVQGFPWARQLHSSSNVRIGPGALYLHSNVVHSGVSRILEIFFQFRPACLWPSAANSNAAYACYLSCTPHAKEVAPWTFAAWA